MSFFRINGVPLRVLREGNVSVEEGINISKTVMRSSSTNNSPVHMFNNGYTGVIFDIKIIVRDTDTFEGKPVKELLHEWEVEVKVNTIVTNAIDVPNGDYVIDSSKKEQYFDNQSTWSLKFVQYFGAKNSYQGSKIKDSSPYATMNSILQSCSLPLSTNSIGQEKCIRALQMKLKSKGYYIFKEGEILQVDGKFNNDLANAVYKLQQDYKFDYRLTPNGVFDSATRDCLLQI